MEFISELKPPASLTAGRINLNDTFSIVINNMINISRRHSLLTPLIVFSSLDIIYGLNMRKKNVFYFFVKRKIDISKYGWEFRS